MNNSSYLNPIFGTSIPGRVLDLDYTVKTKQYNFTYHKISTRFDRESDIDNLRKYFLTLI